MESLPLRFTREEPSCWGMQGFMEGGGGGGSGVVTIYLTRAASFLQNFDSLIWRTEVQMGLGRDGSPACHQAYL